jgi:hypothetical protein
VGKHLAKILPKNVMCHYGELNPIMLSEVYSPTPKAISARPNISHCWAYCSKVKVYLYKKIMYPFVISFD